MGGSWPKRAARRPRASRERHTNRQAGFTIEFPGNWAVVNQGQARWRDEVESLAEEYGWAETLFETGSSPPAPRTRAVDPTATNIRAGQVVVFTIGSATAIREDLGFETVAQLVRDEPAVLSELAGPLIGTQFTARRTEQLTINDNEALLVEFTSQTELVDEPVQVRVRLYFIEAGDELYLISFFAEERLANSNRALYDQVVQSFEPLP